MRHALARACGPAFARAAWSRSAKSAARGMLLSALVAATAGLRLRGQTAAKWCRRLGRDGRARRLRAGLMPNPLRRSLFPFFLLQAMKPGAALWGTLLLLAVAAVSAATDRCEGARALRAGRAGPGRPARRGAAPGSLVGTGGLHPCGHREQPHHLPGCSAPRLLRQLCLPL